MQPVFHSPDAAIREIIAIDPAKAGKLPLIEFRDEMIDTAQQRGFPTTAATT